MKNNQKKKALIVGGLGFIGSYIAEQLVQRDISVVIFDNCSRGELKNICKIENEVEVIKGDMLNQDDLKAVYEKYKFDIVYIEAALWFSDCENDPQQCMMNNVIGTQNVIQMSKEYNVGKIVFASSASAYGDSKPFPFEETNGTKDYSFYTASKLCCERLLETYYKKYGLKYAVTRYMNVYGPRQDYRRDYTGIVVKTIRNVYHKKAPQIYGSGKQTLDLVYVEDIARANVMVGLCDDAIGVFNISTGVETELNLLVDKIIKLMNSDIKVEHIDSSNEIIGRRCASYKKALNTFNYTPEINVDEGLKKTINWYLEEMEVAI